MIQMIQMAKRKSPKRKFRNSVIIQDHLLNRLISGERKNVHDLPDIPIPEDQFEKLKQKYVTAKKVNTR